MIDCRCFEIEKELRTLWRDQRKRSLVKVIGLASYSIMASNHHCPVLPAATLCSIKVPHLDHLDMSVVPHKEVLVMEACWNTLR